MKLYRKITRFSFILLCSFAFSAVSHDASRTLLADLFGSVNGLLTGNDGLAALLFRIFNVSIMIFGSMFAAITITQAVIQTSAQGVFMGKKGSQTGYFTLFRTFGGLALVFPQSSGYSTVQILVMSIVLKSVTLASNLSHEILEQSMIHSPEFLFVSQESDGAAQVALNASKLDHNPSIQNFYRGVIKGSVCAVEYNRLQGVPSSNPSTLYSVDNGMIKFTGCPFEHHLNFSKITKNKLEAENYQKVLEGNINLLIHPIMSYIYYHLPTVKSDQASQECFSRNPESCSSGMSAAPEFLRGVKRSIESSHDALANLFTIRIPKPPKEQGAAVTQDFLYNWIDFPVMYQAIMDVKASGREITNMKDLITASIGSDSGSSHGDTFTDLSSGVNSFGSGNETRFDMDIFNMSFESQISSSGSVVNAKRATFEETVKTYLKTMMYKPSYMDEGEPRTLKEIWENDGYKKWNDGAATLTKEQERLKTKDGTERALKDPVDAFIYFTANKWVEAYVTNMPQMVLSPARKLGEVAAYMGGQSTIFIFTIMRNVVAEQTIRAYNLFWTFFGTKIGLSVTKSITSMSQEFMWDWMHCLLYPPQPLLPGFSPRWPACNPMIIIAVIPIINPGWAAEFPIAITSMTVATAANVAAHVTDSVTSGLFSYLHMLASQYEYAYYGYIVMAATPVMVVSNLLAVWIPMLPSLIYFISIVGWLFVVVEAMIAAPLVIMGVTFPQGHDFLGSSHQALALLLSVYLRAPLIVIGFFIGMLLLSISMLALSYGLVQVGLNMFTDASPTLGDGFLFYAFMVVVLYITSVLLMQSLSFIYKLPNKILLWVGAQQTDGSEEEAVQSIQSIVSQQEGSALGALGQSGMSGKSGSEGVAAQSSGGFKGAKSY